MYKHCFCSFQVSSEKSSASSLVSRCIAAIAMSELTQPLLSLDTERIHHMLDVLRERCPNQSKAGKRIYLFFPFKLISNTVNIM